MERMNSKTNIKDNKESNKKEDVIEAILDPNKDSDPSMTNFICTLIGIAVIAFALFTHFLPPIWPLHTKTLEQTGAFGDSYGILTSFFSCLTFMGLMFTIKQQQTANRMQRAELAETRKEMKRTARAQEHQAEYLKTQLEEERLFRTIELLKSNIERISYLGKNGSQATKNIVNDIQTISSNFSPCNDPDRNVEKFIKQMEPELSKIINSLYACLYLIAQCEEKEAKERHLQILATQLSADEHMLIYHYAENCMKIGKKSEFERLYTEMNFINFSKIMFDPK